jgi:glutaredoxin
MKKQNNYLGQQQLQLQEVVVDKQEKEEKYSAFLKKNTKQNQLV